MAFSEASAKKLPVLACIGRVSNVGEAKTSESGVYSMIPINIEGYGASRSTKLMFMFRPEWLVHGFDSASLKEYENGKALEFIYGKNINVRGGISVLKGLVGADDEAFETLADSIMGLPIDEKVGGPNPAQVADVLREFLIENEKGARIGYTLKQQRTKVGTNDEGKPIYKDEPYYEVSEFWVADEKGRDRQFKRAQKDSSGNFKVTFTEEDTPFS